MILEGAEWWNDVIAQPYQNQNKKQVYWEKKNLKIVGLEQKHVTHHVA